MLRGTEKTGTWMLFIDQTLHSSVQHNHFILQWSTLSVSETVRSYYEKHECFAVFCAALYFSGNFVPFFLLLLAYVSCKIFTLLWNAESHMW